MIPDFRVLIHALTDARVEFVVIGGVAFVVHGSARVTWDLDVCYSRDRDNLRNLASALRPFEPALRGAPAGLPFILDWQTLQSGLNFTLTTTAGDIDILGEVTGLGGFDVVARFADRMELYGVDAAVLSLEGLERAKRAAGRPKDLLDLAEIREIRKQLKKLDRDV